MMSIRLYLVCTMVFAPFAAFGQQDVALKSAMEKKDYARLVAIVQSNCRDHKTQSTNRELTVDERLVAAKAWRNCVETDRGRATAMAPFEQQVGIERLLDAPAQEAKATEEAARSEVDFLGLKWGVGVGYSFSSDDLVDEASIVENVVRVSSSKQEQPRVILEFHKYFFCNDKRREGTRGCGPFVAVAAADEEVLSGVAMGFMFGWKTDKSDSDGFSVGIGAILDADVKDLADGFEANAPPPSNETTVRFESKSRWSAVLFVTRTF